MYTCTNLRSLTPGRSLAVLPKASERFWRGCDRLHLVASLSASLSATYRPNAISARHGYTYTYRKSYYIYIYTHTHIHTYICVYVCIYIYIYVYVYRYISLNTPCGV